MVVCPVVPPRPAIRREYRWGCYAGQILLGMAAVESAMVVYTHVFNGAVEIAITTTVITSDAQGTGPVGVRGGAGGDLNTVDVER